MMSSWCGRLCALHPRWAAGRAVSRWGMGGGEAWLRTQEQREQHSEQTMGSLWLLGAGEKMEKEPGAQAQQTGMGALSLQAPGPGTS